MNMVKSKLKIGYIIFLSLLALILSALFAFSFSIFFSEYLPLFLILLFNGAIIILLIYGIFLDCNYIVVDKRRGYLKWKSLFQLHSKWIELNDLTGYVITLERSKIMERRVVHLVNKDRKVILKISGFFCKNIDEILSVLNLPEETNYGQNPLTRKVYIKNS